MNDSVHSIVLHLVLTYHWFAETVSGNKRIEYRKMSPHWKRLIWDRRERITRVRFQRGFEKDPLRVGYFVHKIDIGPCPIEGWDGDFYRIHFGTKQNARNDGQEKAT